MASNSLKRVRGTVAILKHLPGQRRAHYRPRPQLEEARDARVRAAVLHAARNVPFYRELFRAGDLDLGSFRTAADLARLPLVERDLLQRAGDEFRSDTPAGREALTFRTTGSTARPLTVFHDERSVLAKVAYSERERAVESHFVGRRYGYRVLEIRAARGSVPHVHEFYGRTSFRPFRPARTFADRHASRAGPGGDRGDSPAGGPDVRRLP